MKHPKVHTFGPLDEVAGELRTVILVLGDLCVCVLSREQDQLLRVVMESV